MARGQGREHELEEDIDRIVSGREIEADSAADSQYRADLDFTRRLARARRRPSPAFQSALKSRLLSGLAETESTSETTKKPALKEWLMALLRQRTWQAVGATVAVLLVALVVVWRTGLLSPAPVITTPPPVIAVEARAALNSESYLFGEDIEIDFSFSNVSSETVSFVLPPAFRIETLDANVVRAFNAGVTEVSLVPGVSTSCSLTWDQTNDAGNQVPAGEYQIVMPNLKLGDAGFLSLPQAPLIVILGQ